MLGIILTVLKIIGILLAILILLLLLVLMIPVRYEVRGKNEEELHVKGKIHWLYPLISFQVVYEKEEMKRILRILGVPVWKK